MHLSTNNKYHGHSKLTLIALDLLSSHLFTILPIHCTYELQRQ